jgi:hypothetical protein
MSEFVNEGENLADYIKFMTNAIDRPMAAPTSAALGV